MRNPNCKPSSDATADNHRHQGWAPRRVEFEYRRGATLAYFAAYDVHRAEVHISRSYVTVDTWAR
jgi:hypothetical protein